MSSGVPCRAVSPRSRSRPTRVSLSCVTTTCSSASTSPNARATGQPWPPAPTTSGTAKRSPSFASTVTSVRSGRTARTRVPSRTSAPARAAATGRGAPPARRRPPARGPAQPEQRSDHREPRAERQPEPLEPVARHRRREDVAFDVYLARDEGLTEAERRRPQQQAPKGAARMKDDGQATVVGSDPRRRAVPQAKGNRDVEWQEHLRE